ncbi:MAG: hypothetical protein RIS52_360 [Pseudomonadota bacterium]
MISPAKVGLILLAAGQSRRFGASNKLTVDLCGTALGLHCVAALTAFDFAHRVAVVGVDGPDYRAVGFNTVSALPGQFQSQSLAQGVSALEQTATEACLVVLADMPFITRDHIAALLSAYEGHALASQAAHYRGPPVLFPRAAFDQLTAIRGDQGARRLMATARTISTDEAQVRDIDTPEDLAHAQASLRVMLLSQTP